MATKRKNNSSKPARFTAPESAGDLHMRIPEAFAPLLYPAPYKVAYGGRGGGKSWAFADAAIADAYTQNHLWLCTREYQNSIRDSVYQILIDTIDRRGLTPYFKFTQSEIWCPHSGSRFIFKGLHHAIQEIKSLEGVDRCWVEEAQNISSTSLTTLLPTVMRRPGSEMWFSFNPCDKTDAVYKLFIENDEIEDFETLPGTVLMKVNWNDNPHFPAALEVQRLYDYKTDPAKYAWVWGGECRGLDELAIFHNVIVEGFDSPPIGAVRDPVRWRFGADWGFSKDPSVLIRSFIKDGICYIDEEAYEIGVELDHLPDFWRRIPGADQGYLIYADKSRPETISHMRRRGFNVRPAMEGKVGKNPKEEGIAYLQNFKKIVVHPRCKRTAEEFRTYRWKVIKTTETISRVPEDRNDHCMDSIRYCYDEEIYHKYRGLDIPDIAVKAFLQRGA